MKNKPNIVVIGPSGSGKSFSLSNLPREHTALIDLERKGFPFLDVDKFSMFRECENLDQANSAIAEAANDSKIRLVVVDSLIKYSEMADAHVRNVLKRTGYDIQNFHNAQIGKLFEALRQTQKVFILTDLDEIVWVETPDGGRVSRLRAAITYRQWEGKIEKEFLITVVCEVRMVNNKPTHVFRWLNDGVGPAKCPPYIKLPDVCPNDLNLIVSKLSDLNLL